MLPHRHRLDLRHAAPFYTFSHKRHFPTVSLYWDFSRASTHDVNHAPQAAVIISKKVAPTAVARNRVKRVLRAELSGLFPTLPTGLKLVVVVKHVSLLENLVPFRAELSKLISRSSGQVV